VLSHSRRSRSVCSSVPTRGVRVPRSVEAAVNACGCAPPPPPCRGFPHRGVRGGFRHTTFETLCRASAASCPACSITRAFCRKPNGSSVGQGDLPVAACLRRRLSLGRVAVARLRSSPIDPAARMWGVMYQRPPREDRERGKGREVAREEAERERERQRGSRESESTEQRATWETWCRCCTSANMPTSVSSSPCAWIVVPQIGTAVQENKPPRFVALEMGVWPTQTQQVSKETHMHTCITSESIADTGNQGTVKRPSQQT